MHANHHIHGGILTQKFFPVIQIPGLHAVIHPKNLFGPEIQSIISMILYFIPPDQNISRSYFFGLDGATWQLFSRPGLATHGKNQGDDMEGIHSKNTAPSGLKRGMQKA